MEPLDPLVHGGSMLLQEVLLEPGIGRLLLAHEQPHPILLREKVEIPNLIVNKNL